MFRVLDVEAAVPTSPLPPGSVLAGSPEAGSRAMAAVSGAESSLSQCLAVLALAVTCLSSISAAVTM